MFKMTRVFYKMTRSEVPFNELVFLGELNNPNFKPLEFERFKNEAGSNWRSAARLSRPEMDLPNAHVSVPTDVQFHLLSQTVI